MIRAFLLALADLADRRVLAILLRSLAVTILIFLALGVGAAWLLDGVDLCSRLSDVQCPLDPAASGIGALALTLVGLWFLFPAVAIGVVSAYSDRIAAAVEARHYPLAAASARPLGLAGGTVLGLRSAARLLAANLVAFPLYLLLLVTGIGTIVLFVVVNGLALGRDLGEMAAARHGDRSSRRAWLHASRQERRWMGVIVTSLFLVPFVNLIAPILGAAMATHLYHRRRR
jgi:uncharacterized protein involved in cysteine biosynthesis